MSQFVTEARVARGRLELANIPFSDNTEVKVFVIPKAKLSRMSFLEARNLSRTIKGNLASDIVKDRDAR